MSRRPLVTIFVVVALLVAAAGCDWSQVRFGPGRTGAGDGETSLGPTSVSNLRLRWKQVSRKPSQYGTTGGTVISGGVVYATGPATDANRIQALDAATGQGRWLSAFQAGSVSVDAAVGGLVYVHGNGGVAALDSATGAARWSTASSNNESSETAVVGDIAYVNVSGTVSACDRTTGAVRWSWGGHVDDSVFAAPTVADGQVLVPVWEGGLVALDAATGAQRWRSNPADTYVVGTVAATGGLVFETVTSSGGGVQQLRALDATSGTVKWSTSVAPDAGQVAVTNDTVLLVTASAVESRDRATGQLRWSVPESTAFGSPSVANGVVYLGTEAGRLVAYQLSTGALLWTSPSLGAAVMDPPSIADGTAYVQSSDGVLWAFALPGSGARLGVAPVYADLGDSAVGTASSPETFTVTNFGTAKSSPLASALSGTNRSSFRVTTDGCTGVSLVAGATCTITGSFAPSLGGPKTASLDLSAATGGTVRVGLLGHGLGPGLQISPTTKDFGTVAVGSQAAATFTITNPGGASSGRVSVQVYSWGTPPYFISTDGCTGTSIPSHGTCTFSVVFRPLTVGAQGSVPLIVSAQDTVTGTTFAAQLTGTGK